jgi:YbgC/YbaW family acyl-CoA thioester hydrolase
MLPGYAFAARLRVRYAEIDGQKIVFNSRYLEYVDVAVTDWWEWTGIEAALGDAWRALEFNVRRAEIDYLKPFRLGDRIDAHVRIERIGGTSLTKRFALAHADTGEVHCEVALVSVCVDLAVGRPVPIGGPVRTFLEGVLAGQPEWVA